MPTDLPARLAALLGDPPENSPAYSAPAEDDRGDWFTTLHGPGDFVCRLGEPEDRNWCRDGSDVIERLNALHSLAVDMLAEVQRLTDENAGYRNQFAEANENAPRALVDALDSLTRAVVRAETAEAAHDALLAEVQAARAEAVACRAVAEEAIEKLDEAASFANFGADADDIRGWADELLNDPRLATHGPAAAQAAIDEYTEAVMEACGAIDAERTPRTISARATVARLLGLPEVAR